MPAQTEPHQREVGGAVGDGHPAGTAGKAFQYFGVSRVVERDVVQRYRIVITGHHSRDQLALHLGERIEARGVAGGRALHRFDVLRRRWNEGPDGLR